MPRYFLDFQNARPGLGGASDEAHAQAVPEELCRIDPALAA
jgi:hypothetical protein